MLQDLSVTAIASRRPIVRFVRWCVNLQTKTRQSRRGWKAEDPEHWRVHERPPFAGLNKASVQVHTCASCTRAALSNGVGLKFRCV